MKLLTLPVLMLAAAPAFADWSLASGSDVAFISTKNTDVTEVHHFRTLTGSVTDSGDATVSIQLASVDTGIPIRNERLLNMLFESAKFPVVSISAHVPEPTMTAVKAGKTTSLTLPVSVDFHGIKRTMDAGVLVMPAADGSVIVSTTEPLLLKAEDFGVAGGVDALRAVANLDRISATVPVTFTLVYNLQK